MKSKELRILINKLMNHYHRRIRLGVQSGLKTWKAVKCDKTSSIRTGEISARNNCHFDAKAGGEIIIGDNTHFNYNCIVAARKRIEIGKNVFIGPNVIIYDHDHDYKNKEWSKMFTSESVCIGDDVWIGGNVVILKGTSIGKRCVIAAGTIIKGDKIPPFSLVYGSVKTVIRPIGEYLDEYKNDH